MAKSTVNASSADLWNLRALVKFLNLDVESVSALTTPVNTSVAAERQVRILLAVTSSLSATTAELLGIQRNLRADLLAVVRPDSDSDTISGLKALVEKIDEMKLRAEREVLPSSELKPYMKLSSIVELGRKQFALVEYEANDTSTMGFYRVLDSALKSGVFSQIRNCPHCENFFLLKDPRMEYCSPSCRTAARIKRKTKAGYYKQKMRESRQKAKYKKKKELAAQRRQSVVQVYFKKLIDAEQIDRDGKLLTIYKRLGGAQEGRRLLSKLKKTPWNEVKPDVRKKILELSKEYPL